MTVNNNAKTKPYGGDWTIKKLQNLEAYADAYTTALKNRNFNLIYLDAFAGEGAVSIKSGTHAGQTIDGSAKVALDIRNKPFDKLIFVEQDERVATRLRDFVRQTAPDRNTTVINEDANIAVPDFARNMGDFDRALVLLDPFNTEVRWETVESLAETKKCDVLILFPTMAITRMMARYEEPGEARFQDKLTEIYGSNVWEKNYQPRQQPSMFSSDPSQERAPGTDALVQTYLEQLDLVFEMAVSQTLQNSRNSAMFEFIVAAGSKPGAPIARRIATSIIRGKGRS